MGLRDVIAVLNSLFVGCLVAVLVIIPWPGLGYTVTITLAVVAIAITWFAHAWYERRSCCQAATKASEYVRFPKNEVDQTGQGLGILYTIMLPDTAILSSAVSESSAVRSNPVRHYVCITRCLVL